MKFLVVLIFSISCFASEYFNRFSLGDFGYSNVSGNLYSLEYIRYFEEIHAVVLRTNQATDSSAAEYMIGYRYYFGEISTKDSSFLEVGYKRDRDRIGNVFQSNSDLARVVYGYQWIFFERMNLDIGAGYEFDIKGEDGSQVTGVFSVGLLF